MTCDAISSVQQQSNSVCSRVRCPLKDIWPSSFFNQLTGDGPNVSAVAVLSPEFRFQVQNDETPAFCVLCATIPVRRSSCHRCFCPFHRWKRFRGWRNQPQIKWAIFVNNNNNNINCFGMLFLKRFFKHDLKRAIRSGTNWRIMSGGRRRREADYFHRNFRREMSEAPSGLRCWISGSDQSGHEHLRLHGHGKATRKPRNG